MSEEVKENIKILNHLVEYLQEKIDTGYHKIFYNDLGFDEKTIDCIKEKIKSEYRFSIKKIRINKRR